MEALKIWTHPSAKHQGYPTNNDLTISVQVRDSQNALGEITRIFLEHKIEIDNLNILRFPIEKYSKIVIRTHGNRFFLPGIMEQLNNCGCILGASIVSAKDTLNYGLVTFKLRTRALAMTPELQNIMKKFNVEYIDFVKDHFIVGYFGNEVQIATLLGRLTPYGIVEYSRSTLCLLKEDMALKDKD